MEDNDDSIAISFLLALANTMKNAPQNVGDKAREKPAPTLYLRLSEMIMMVSKFILV